jgi:hypothetical protein
MLTELNSSGEKLTSNVYAGGAVIATNTTAGVGKFLSKLGGHDLAGYKHYSNIVKNCSIDQ